MKRPTVRPNPHATAFRAADLGIRNVFRLRLAPVGEIVKSAPIADVDVTGNVANGMTVDAGDRVAFGGPKRALRLRVHGNQPRCACAVGSILADVHEAPAKCFLASQEAALWNS